MISLVSVAFIIFISYIQLLSYMAARVIIKSCFSQLKQRWDLSACRDSSPSAGTRCGRYGLNWRWPCISDVTALVVPLSPCDSSCLLHTVHSTFDLRSMVYVSEWTEFLFRRRQERELASALACRDHSKRGIINACLTNRHWACVSCIYLTTTALAANLTER